MVMGAAIIRRDNLQVFNDTMSKYRTDTKMPYELKWSKVNSQKLTEYKIFVDYFFALNNENKTHFKCIIIDNVSAVNRKFKGIPQDVRLHKQYHSLILHKFGKKYYKVAKPCRFILHPDQRETKQNFEEAKEFLNRSMRTAFNDNTISPFVAIMPVESHNCELVQIVDILIGAIGFEKNGNHLLSGSNNGKIELCKYIAEKAGLKTLTDCTGYFAKRFEIWNLKPKN
jgi:hypothetical protein